MKKVTLKMIWSELQSFRSSVDSRFDQVSSELQGIDRRIDKIDGRLDNLELDTKIIRNQTAHLTERVTEIEKARAV